MSGFSDEQLRRIAAGGELSDADVGLAPSPTTSTWGDVAKSAGQGLLTGAEGLIGLPGDIGRAARWAGNKATYPLDYGMAWAEGWARQKAGRSCSWGNAVKLRDQER